MPSESKLAHVYWIAGLAIAVAAIRTALAGAMTYGSAFILLGGTLLLIWALFKSGRTDAPRIAVSLLIVGELLAMLTRYIRR
jgi:hypothetical protein